MTDSRDYKDAEEALRASEERFHTLVQFSFDVYWETDEQHRFTRQEFSGELADAPARSSEIGKTRWEVPYLEPDEEAWRAHRATLEAHLPFRDFELARPTPDGGRRYVSVSGVPVFDETGRFIGYRGVGRRITDRKRSEQALRQSEAYLSEAQRLTHTGSWAYHPLDRRMTYWSDETYRIFGLDPRRGSLPSAEELRRLVHPEDLEPFVEANRKALRGTDDFAIECRLVLRDGVVKHVQTIGHPVFDGAGRVVEWVGTLVDVTDRRRAEEEHRAHVWVLESMDRINRAIQGTHDLEKTMSVVLDAVLEIFDCDRAWLLYPCDPDTASWRVVMEQTRPEFPGAFALGTDLPIDRGVAAVFAAARASDGALLFGLGHELKASSVIERFTIRSQMAMAVHPKGDQPYLFGVHQCSRARRWTAEEERLFREIGRRLTDALTSLLMFRSLQESERRFEAAQRIAHVGWWERDFITNHVSLSEEVRRILGVQPVELPQWQQRWLSVIHPDDRAKAAEAAAAAVRGGPRYDIEYRVIRPDGTVRIVNSQGDVTWDELGRPLRQFGALQDVTDLRRAEEELRVSEARFRTWADHAMDAFFLHDEDLIVIDVNRQACESLGYRREELIGRHPRDFDTGLDEGSIVQLADRVGAGETVTFETIHRRKDGAVFPVEIRARVFQQGDRRFRLSLARDITERKRAEKRLQAEHTVAEILADAPSVEEATPRILQAVCECLDWDLGTLWRIDREAGELRCAQVWRKASLDAGPFEAATRESAFALGVGLPGRVWASRVPACIPDVVHDGNFLRAKVAARSGLHAAFAFPILLGGEVLGVIDFFSRDIRQPDAELLELMASLGSQIGQFIERQRAEEALRVAHAELAHLARVMTMGELTASIAHEINQPLLGIVTSASSCSRWLAAEPPNLARAQRALERIVTAGTRASEVIDRIRTLVKRQPMRMEPVDLNAIVREVLAMVRHEVHRSAVSLRTRLADELPAIAGDRVQLQQVVLNLMLNAIEATREVEGRARQVWVATRVVGNKDVHVEVRDSGVGLAPESRARVFEAFYSMKSSGLGMGLSISKSIIEAHGGRISATANSPHGAVFSFRLPVASEDAAAS